MKPSLTRLCRRPATLMVIFVLALAGGGLWWLQQANIRPSQNSDRRTISMAAIPSHRVLGSFAPGGMLQTKAPLPSLDAALGLDSKLVYKWRLEVVHHLGSGLSPEQIGRLVAFIQEPVLPEGLSAPQVRALKNDVLNVLGAQKEFRPKLAVLLARLSQDKAQDSALRDYALQQLSGLDAKEDGLAHWQAIDGDDSGLAATAMLHLLALDRNHLLSSLDRRRLAGRALELAGDGAQPETSRSTALLVCGQLKMREARLLAYDIARSDTASFPFRIAAVATLGDLGGDSDTRDYLVSLVAGSEKRLRIPAASALRRFSLN